MATLNLTREETARLILGRTPGYFEVLNLDFPEHSECGDKFDFIDDQYQAIETRVETAINGNDEVWGIDETGEAIPIIAFPDKKPPVTRPTFPV